MELEQIKDEALKSIDKMITTKAKADAINFLRGTVLAAVKDFADGLAQALKNSSTGKTGWCYLRDAYLFPSLLKIVCWGLGKVLDAVAAATEKEMAAEAAVDATAQASEQEGNDAPAAQPEQA